MLVIDLDRREDLEFARRMIEERLGTQGSTSETVSDERRGALSERAQADREAEFVNRLWSRITTEKTRDLLRAFASADGPFTLREVAQRMSADVEAVRAQKFRLGRSEKRLWDELKVGLFEDQDWDGSENRYTLRPGIREAIRKKAAGN